MLGCGKDHLRNLESESIYIIREAFCESKNPVMLYSIGKDSSVLLHLAIKAFHPQPLPFPIMHIDTGWKFKDMYRFRDKISKKNNIEIIIFQNKEGFKKNINPNDYSSEVYTDIMKTQALKMALDNYKFDLSFGGARRDEEKSRAKERIISIRNKKHAWEPKIQKPEIWDLYNLKKNENQSIRVFPLSNWTEIDIWQYIYEEGIEIVDLYFSKKRPVILRNDTIIMVDDKRIKLKTNEKINFKNIRFRTLGCYPLTAGIESGANTIALIIDELTNTKNSERQGRLIDKDNSSMEIKKMQGYF